MNYAIDFEQLFVRIFGNFWYQSIRQTQENVHLLGTKFKNNFETILHDPLGTPGIFRTKISKPVIHSSQDFKLKWTIQNKVKVNGLKSKTGRFLENK